MESPNEFYSVLAVAIVAVVAVGYLVSTLAPIQPSSNGITGAVIGSQETPQEKFQSEPVNIDWAKLFFGVTLAIVCIALVYNMYKKNE